MLLSKIPIREKILLSFTGLFLIINLLTLLIISMAVFKVRRSDMDEKLEQSNLTMVQLVSFQVRQAVAKQLEEEALSALSVVEYVYARGLSEGMDEKEIKENLVSYLSIREIGDSGYLYILDSLGDIRMHPYPELVGTSLIEYDFIRSQVKSREGYIEYVWKNPGEETFREKALFMAYFEPFDWILSASAYKDEFASLVNLEDVRESLNNIPMGDRGYPFILDREGNLLIHPRLEGENVHSLVREDLDTAFLREIPRTLNGAMSYEWKDSESGKIIDKRLLYRHFPDLDWIIVTSIPEDEYTGIFDKFYYIMTGIFLVALLCFYLISKQVAQLLTRPLAVIMDFIGGNRFSELSGRLEVEGKDEFSLLSRNINKFLDAIEEETNNRLIAEEENRILAQFTNGNPYPVMRVDAKGNILYVNRASIELMKYWDIAFHTRLPGDLVAMINDFGSDFSDFEYKKKNRVYNIMLSHFPAQDSCYLLISDITLRKEDEYLLIMSESVFSHTMEGIMITDPDGTIVRVNPAFSKITGYGIDEVKGKNPRVLSSNHHSDEFYRSMWSTLKQTGIWSGEVWNRRKNGDAYPEWLTINSISDDKGHLIHYVGIFKDISDLKESEEKLRYQVSHDALTGLPNRILFEDRLNRAIARTERGGQNLAVLFLDMDNFKNINDSLGHQAGDAFLKIIAERLLQSCRGEDTVARLGGDEFVVLIPELTEQHNIIEITNRIQTTVGSPLLISTHELHPSVSIGVTVYPEDGDNPQLLMKNADLAMYKAKDMGKGTYSLFNKEMNRQVKKRMELESQLKKSLERKEMFLVYQPKVDVRTGRIDGVEALIRWNSRKIGPVSPVDFIPLAEETGFIHVLGDWVLETALRDMSLVMEKTGLKLETAVNLSARQFRDDQLINRIEGVMAKSGFEPSLINFEITEHAAMDESEESLGIMSRLRQLGVHLSIDDFGTGYSSYSYLKQFQVQFLKIDKLFIDEVPGESKTSAIMRNIIDLGHTLDMKVVAEGVEHREQLDFLIRAGCDYIQGYYFYKPMPSEELIGVLNQQNDTEG